MNPINFLRNIWRKWEQRTSCKNDPSPQSLPHLSVDGSSLGVHASKKTSNGTHKNHKIVLPLITEDVDPIPTRPKWPTTKHQRKRPPIDGRLIRRQSLPSIAADYKNGVNCSSVVASSCYGEPMQPHFVPRFLEQTSRPSSNHPRLPSLHFLPAMELGDTLPDVNIAQDSDEAHQPSNPPHYSFSPSPILMERNSDNDHNPARDCQNTAAWLAPPTLVACGTRNSHDQPYTLTNANLDTAPKSNLSYNCGSSITTNRSETSSLSTESRDVHDFPLSLFPEPPHPITSKEVPRAFLRLPPPRSPPKYTLIRPSTAPQSGSPKTHLQAHFCSPAKRCFGRPIASVSPPPTRPPTSPLPTPPTKGCPSRTASVNISTQEYFAKQLASIEYVMDRSATIPKPSPMLNDDPIHYQKDQPVPGAPDTQARFGYAQLDTPTGLLL